MTPSTRQATTQVCTACVSDMHHVEGDLSPTHLHVSGTGSDQDLQRAINASTAQAQSAATHDHDLQAALQQSMREMTPAERCVAAYG